LRVVAVFFQGLTTTDSLQVGVTTLVSTFVGAAILLDILASVCPLNFDCVGPAVFFEFDGTATMLNAVAAILPSIGVFFSHEVSTATFLRARQY